MKVGSSFYMFNQSRFLGHLVRTMIVVSLPATAIFFHGLIEYLLNDHTFSLITLYCQENSELFRLTILVNAIQLLFYYVHFTKNLKLLVKKNKIIAVKTFSAYNLSLDLVDSIGSGMENNYLTTSFHFKNLTEQINVGTQYINIFSDATLVFKQKIHSFTSLEKLKSQRQILISYFSHCANTEIPCEKITRRPPFFYTLLIPCILSAITMSACFAIGIILALIF
ncbi:MAG: hypothetical protein R3Y45_09185 [Bacillota bacterium]